jgi:hypothetical protein
MVDKAPESFPKIYTGLESERFFGRPSEGKEWSRLVKRDVARRKAMEIEPENPYAPDFEEIDFDSHFTLMAEKAKKEGRNKLVILDIGSGQKGRLVFSFSDLAENRPELTKFLDENPGFEVEVVGLTAPLGKQEPDQLIEEDAVERPNQSSVSMKNFTYLITRARPLSDFIDKHLEDSKKADVILSTWGLAYFTPANFAQAIEDAINNLNTGGAFIGISYHACPPGFTRSAAGLGVNLNVKTRPNFYRDNLGLTKDDHFLTRVDLGATLQNTEPDFQRESFRQFLEFLMSRKLISVGEVQDRIRSSIRVRDPHLIDEPRLKTKFIRLKGEKTIKKIKESRLLTDDDLSPVEFLELVSKMPSEVFDRGVHMYRVYDNLYTHFENTLISRVGSKSQKRISAVLSKLKETPELKVVFGESNFFIEKEKELTQQLDLVKATSLS